MVRATVLAAFVSVVLCSGCASIVSGTSQSVSLTTSSDGSDVDGAKCALVNDKGSWFVTSPGSVTVRRSYEDLQVSCTLDGHEKAEQPVKSTTKGMVAGNALIGGVIGIGVDIASGAAYDYPNVIVVAMTRLRAVADALAAGSGNAATGPAALLVATTPAVTAAATATLAVALRPGVRLTWQDLDPVSQAPLGETTWTVAETTATHRVYNDGALVVMLDGTPVKGGVHNAMVYGLGPRELARGGTWSGMFRAAGVLQDVPATFTVVSRQAKVVSGQRFDATRVRVEGYAQRYASGGQSSGAAFTGEALVDNASGLVLELSVTSRYPAYAVRRELVRVSGVD